MADTQISFEDWARQVVDNASQDLMLAALAIDPDFSPVSVAGIDAAMDAMYGTAGEAPEQDNYAPSQGTQNLIFSYGAYVGEVCRGVVDGNWKEDQAHPGEPLWAQVVFADGHVAPLLHVMKRFKNGSKHALFPLLLTITQHDPALRASWGRDFLRQAERTVKSGAMPLNQRQRAAASFCKSASTCDPSLAQEVWKFVKTFG